MKLAVFKFAVALCLLAVSSNNLLAAPSGGVSCRGNTPSYNSNKILKCYKDTRRTFKLGSMCPPARYPLNVVMNSRGRDTCSPIISGNRVTSAKTPPLPGYPPLNKFRRVISSNGVDKFVATISKRNYKHPKGKHYSHNAKKGVICPSGYSSRYRNGRLKCTKRIVKRATCDIGWKLKTRNGKDICQMRSLIGTITGDYTIPQGTTGIGGHPTRFGWKLEIRNGRDNWYKVKYQYPKAAR